MTLGERIKKVRRELDLTQRDFGSQIGTTQNAIASYEIGRREPSAAAINNICKTFNIDEHWLRTGEGEMLLPKADTALELLVTEHSLTGSDRVLIEKFLSLKTEDRMVLVDYVRKVAAAIADQEATASAFAPTHTPTMEEEARAEAEQQAEQIYKQILAEKKAAAELSSESSGPKAGDGTVKPA